MWRNVVSQDRRKRRMNMDLLLWIIRAILIVVGIVLIIVIWKGKKEGRYQKYSFRFFVIGITAFVLGVILLIVSSVTDLSLFYAFYLLAVGLIGVIIGLVIRYRWEKNG
jgi:cell division protein FtsW (lipid II flippase)